MQHAIIKHLEQLDLNIITAREPFDTLETTILVKQPIPSRIITGLPQLTYAEQTIHIQIIQPIHENENHQLAHQISKILHHWKHNHSYLTLSEKNPWKEIRATDAKILQLSFTLWH